jgi:hypothetical protein
MEEKGGGMTMVARYPAPDPRTAVEGIAASWKAAGMCIRATEHGLCAIPGCDHPSVVRIITSDGEWLLCLAHEGTARDLAEGKNPFK